MPLVRLIKSLLPNRRRHAVDTSSAFHVEQFIYLWIPGNYGPQERRELFEDKIEPALAASDLGFVSGGGSAPGREKADGTSEISSCGIDIDTTDRDRALVLLRKLLPEIGVPPGTELHYTKGGARLMDMRGNSTWRIEQPRQALHPGFGI